MSEIPIVYSYIIYRIKKNNKTELINIADVKEISARVLVGNVSRGGFPRFLIRYVLEDLIRLNILEKVNSKVMRIKNKDCDKKLRGLMTFY